MLKRLTTMPDDRITFDARAPRKLARAIGDLMIGFSRWRLAWALAWLDIRNRYRGSVLGPLWLSLSTGIMLAGLGVLYSALWHETLRSYLPFLAVSLIVWNLIAQIISDSTTSLVQAEGMIRQIPLPYTTHALRGVFRNVIIAAHNLPLILIVFAVSRVGVGAVALKALLGFSVIGIDAFAAAMLLGMLCARFRDLGQIVNSIMQIAFFMTPILWKPTALGPRARLLILDPFYSVMQVVRAPLLGQAVGLSLWFSAIAFSILLCAVSFAFFVRFRGRISFWV